LERDWHGLGLPVLFPLLRDSQSGVIRLDRTYEFCYNSSTVTLVHSYPERCFLPLFTVLHNRLLVLIVVLPLGVMCENDTELGVSRVREVEKGFEKERRCD
jgi:hypothetical protein